MYLYFDRLGRLVETIQDYPLRSGSGSGEANSLFAYFENGSITSAAITIRDLAGGIVANANVMTDVAKEIPYDPNADHRFFKDYVEYEFKAYALSADQLKAGDLIATVQGFIFGPGGATDVVTLAQGEVCLHVEGGAVRYDRLVTATEFNVLMANVASTKNGLDSKVSKAGDTMTGDLNMGENAVSFGKGDRLVVHPQSDGGSEIWLPRRGGTLAIDGSYEVYEDWWEYDQQNATVSVNETEASMEELGRLWGTAGKFYYDPDDESIIFDDDLWVEGNIRMGGGIQVASEKYVDDQIDEKVTSVLSEAL